MITNDLPDVCVLEATEAACRKAMARRSRLVAGYGTRGTRAELLTEIDRLLEQYNLLALGR